MRRRRGRDYDGALSLVIWFLMIMFLLPILGVKLINKGTGLGVAGGLVLIIIGIGFWAWLILVA